MWVLDVKGREERTLVVVKISPRGNLKLSSSACVSEIIFSQSVNLFRSLYQYKVMKEMEKKKERKRKNGKRKSTSLRANSLIANPTLLLP